MSGWLLYVLFGSFFMCGLAFGLSKENLDAKEKQELIDVLIYFKLHVIQDSTVGQARFVVLDVDNEVVARGESFFGAIREAAKVIHRNTDGMQGFFRSNLPWI